MDRYEIVDEIISSASGLRDAVTIFEDTVRAGREIQRLRALLDQLDDELRG